LLVFMVKGKLLKQNYRDEQLLFGPKRDHCKSGLFTYAVIQPVSAAHFIGKPVTYYIID